MFFQWPRVRSGLIRLKLKLLNDSQIAATAHIGKSVFVSIPGGYISIGERTRINDRCYLEVSAEPHAELVIGADCYLAHDVHLGAFRHISIGNNVRIAEFTSLRDFTHNYLDSSRHIDRQGDTVGSLSIGDDVWIGQGCIVEGSTEGTIIGRGAVIGAHSIVKASVPEYAIVVGAPARIIGYRTPAQQ